MTAFARRFTAFVNISLRILLLLVLGATLIRTFNTVVELSTKGVLPFILVSSVLITASIAYVFLINKGLKAEINYSKLIILILTVAFILRLLWIFTIDTRPVSDFQLIFESGGRFIDGDYSMFKGTGYIARFTHLTMSVIYYGIFHKVFPNALVAIKISNVIWSTLNVYLIYLIVAELYNDKSKGIWGALIASLYPPFIMYTSVLCTENHAMPFFLGSVYVFLLVIKEIKSSEWMLLSGLLLFIGHVFRMVGYVIIMAYIIYIILYLPSKKKVKAFGYILASFIIPFYITSTILINLDITEYSLWKGREPSSTSILRGTNISSNGAWNEEDAKIPEKYNYDYKEVEKASKKIIKDRLTNTSPLVLLKFYIIKFTSEWSKGDFAALYWSTLEINNPNTAYVLSKFIEFYSQLVYLIVFSLVYIGLYNEKQYGDSKTVNLLYILFCGFGLLYLITENQSRYGFIASWIFIILVFTSIDNGYLRYQFSRVHNNLFKTYSIKPKDYYSES
jgi:4-amino-4-deoxy-L-arabinose transferase-like glycosyltransferase